jgi:hypothetical protein
MNTRGSKLGSVALALLAAACSDSAWVAEAHVSDQISTVVTVRWTTEQPSIGYVEYGPTREMEFNTPIEADETREHSQVLYGLKPDTEYYFRAVTWDGDDAGASEIGSVRTGNLPVGMPKFTVQGDGHDQFIVAPILGTNTAALILDPDGDIVWYHVPDGELDIYRARLSVDGKSLLYNWASVSGDPANDSALVRVALDGSGSSSVDVPLLAHDFVEHEDGTVAAIVVEYRTVETVWSAWDCFDPAVDRGEALEDGWTFANALDYDPVENAYYLGMRNFGSITKIDRETGACDWVFGLAASTIEIPPEAALFFHQHQFDLRGNRILVMDNDGLPGKVSRVLEYELDFEANRATEVWSYVSDPSVYTFVLGEPTRLDGGDVFINWSAAGQMERVTAAGSASWKLNSGAGVVFGFNTLAKSLYPSDARSP